MPFPYRTVSEGVIWVPEQSLVRAGTDGFVRRVVASPGSQVTRGQVLIECFEPLLVSQSTVLHAQLEELQSRYDEALPTDPVQVKVLREEITNINVAIARSEQQIRDLDVLSPADGVFVLPDAEDLPDLHLKQGDLFGYVLDVNRPTIRVVVPQADVDLVRRRVRGVDVRMADRFSTILPARVKREVPEAAQRLPSTVLGSAGGGRIAVDPSDARGTKAYENLFQLDIELAEPLEHVYVGARAYVRFDLGTEPIGLQVARRLRQLFLRRFSV